MTKPVTAVATLILVEECVLRLDEPVERLLPELADRRVVRRIDGPIDDTVPARRSITVRDLLTFRMGFGAYFGPCPVNDAAAPLQLSVGPPEPSLPPEPDEWMRRLSTLPLMCQHGSITPVRTFSACSSPAPATGRSRRSSASASSSRSG
jgi:CubicO group peptidase (beta-lactamase class C family)